MGPVQSTAEESTGSEKGSEKGSGGEGGGTGVSGSPRETVYSVDGADSRRSETARAFDHQNVIAASRGFTQRVAFNSSKVRSETVPLNREGVAARRGADQSVVPSESEAEAASSPTVSLFAMPGVGSDMAYSHQYIRRTQGAKQYSVAEYSFKSSAAVRGFIRLLVQKRTFSMAAIKRSVHKVLVRDYKTDISSKVLRKPDGNNVHEMFDPVLFRAGQFTLRADTCPLKLDQFAAFHRRSCKQCGERAEGLSPSCYFSSMHDCVKKGWNPPVQEDQIRPLHRIYPGNYPGVALYDASSRKEIVKMIHNGVLVECGSARSPNGVRSPLGIVVKNSDKMRSSVLVNVVVEDEATMMEANRRLRKLCFVEIKARITSDLSASGVNRAAYTPPFSYPSLQDGIRMIKRFSYIGKCDVSRYFHSFPLAYEARHLFEVEYDGRMYTYARCPFGFSPCPFYCSTWSAEFKSWLRSLDIETAHLMDDWMVVDDTRSAVEVELDKVCAMFEEVGFGMAKEKNQIGQVLTFLGVEIDTVTMTMRFDPTQSMGMRLELETFRDRLIKGGQLSHTTIRHVCGKLNWYSEVVQSGRLHLRSWWCYDKYHRELLASTFNKMLTDTQWWIDLLQAWENGTSSGFEYTILSAEELLTNKESIFVLQSDASGTDGFGYYYGFSEAEFLSWVSKRWPPGRVLISSHVDELWALCDFLEHMCTVRDAIFVWVTDSESAMWSINKGRCFEPEGLNLVSRILARCDLYHLQIVALWVPRELNDLADYLSHLSFIIDSDQVAGTWSADELLTEVHRGAPGQQRAQEGHGEHREALFGVSVGAPSPPLPCETGRAAGVPTGLHQSAQRLHQVASSGNVIAEGVRPLQPSQLVEREGPILSQSSGGRAPVERPVPCQAGQAVDSEHRGRDGEYHGSRESSGALGRHDNDIVSQQPHAIGRVAQRPEGQGRRVGPCSTLPHSEDLSQQGSSARRLSAGAGCRLPGPQRLQAGEEVVQQVGPVELARRSTHSARGPRRARLQADRNLRLVAEGDQSLSDPSRTGSSAVLRSFI